MSDLRTRAAAAAQPADGTDAGPGWPARAEPVEPAELEPVDYDSNAITDAEVVAVHVAWARVMADVQSIRKDQVAKVETAKSSYRYNFRGVDKVFNAVGPALRRHGVMVLPVKVDTVYGRATSAGGGGMRECTVTVTYRIIGPAGDYLEVQSAGEGLDTSDKATVKAMTMAYRNLLVNGLTVPTEDPKLDPDRVHLERGEQPLPRATDYRDEVADPRTSLNRLRQIRSELRQHGLATTVVVNESGDDEALLAMCERIGRQRAEAGER